MEKEKEIPLETRTFTITKETGYKIPSKGLIRSWTITDCELSPKLLINGIEYTFPRTNPLKICIEEIRSYLQDTNNILEPNMERLENQFYMQQLLSTEYYLGVSNKDLFKSLYTKDYEIKLDFGEEGPEKVGITEEYWNRNK